MTVCDNHRQGFTFIELLIVAILIGILAAIVLPSYRDYLIRSQTAESLLLTLSIKRAISDYYGTHGQLPPDNKTAGVAQPESLMSNYISRVDVVNGNIDITFGNICDASIYGNILRFRPRIDNTVLGTIHWQCGRKKTTLPAKYLPLVCK